MVDVPAALSECSRRAAELNGELRADRVSLPVTPIEVLTQKVEMSSNSRLREELSSNHHNRMIDAYLKNGDIETALFHGKLAYRYGRSAELANNLGYICLTTGHLSDAQGYLEEACRTYKKSEDLALCSYNMGLVDLKKHDFEAALARCEYAKEQLQQGGERKKPIYLIVPSINESDLSLQFDEDRTPDLSMAIHSAISVIARLRKSLGQNSKP